MPQRPALSPFADAFKPQQVPHCSENHPGKSLSFRQTKPPAIDSRGHPNQIAMQNLAEGQVWDPALIGERQAQQSNLKLIADSGTWGYNISLPWVP